MRTFILQRPVNLDPDLQGIMKAWSSPACTTVPYVIRLLGGYRDGRQATLPQREWPSRWNRPPRPHCPKRTHAHQQRGDL